MENSEEPQVVDDQHTGPPSGGLSRRTKGAIAAALVIVVVLAAVVSSSGGSSNNPLNIGNGGGPGGGPSQPSSGAPTPDAAVQDFYTDLSSTNPASVCAILSPAAQRDAAKGGLLDAEGEDAVLNDSAATCAAAAAKLQGLNIEAVTQQELQGAASDQYQDQQYSPTEVYVQDSSQEQFEQQQAQATEETGDNSGDEPNISDSFLVVKIGGAWFISRFS